jgi:Helix-turn-helix domain
MKRNINISDGQNKRSHSAPTPALSMDERLAFSLREAARILGISYSSAHRLCQRGQLRSASGLRRKVIAREELLRFLRVPAA